MYELIQAGENTWYINCPAKIGIYLEHGAEVWLIDSGGDKDAGRRVKNLLEEKGWRMKAILNTHSNADHIGGNRFLQDRFQCPIYCTPIENAFIENPVLEPSVLYGGFPCRALRKKFLMAKDSRAQGIETALLPPGMEWFRLGGHFFDMIGFRTPDDVVFLADCLVGEDVLNKYAVSFLYDVEEYLNTLYRVERMEAKLFVRSLSCRGDRENRRTCSCKPRKGSGRDGVY